MSSLRPMEIDFDIFSGQLTYRPAPNFSYHEIPANCCIKIPKYQQMIVHDIIEIDGTLTIDGELVVIN